jgi:hypothetical protein
MRPKRDRPVAARPFNTGNADDDARLEALTDIEPLSVPRRWSHFLHFGDEAMADTIAQGLEGEWQTNVVPSPAADGWTLQAIKEGVVLTEANVTEARAELTTLAQSLGGRYDGWLAWV